jgi:hypothetical protein
MAEPDPQELAKRKALEIYLGERPNEVTHRPDAQSLVMSLPEIGDRIGEMISTGKFVTDPPNVKNARYSTRAAAELIMFSYDFVSLYVGKAINFLAEYQESRINPDEFPLYRLMFDRPVFDGGNAGSTMNRSLLATRRNQVGAVFVELFVEQATITNRFTREQRSAYERRTGRKLKDQFWRIKRWELNLPDRNKFHLFLPSGLDYSLTPWVRPDGVIEFRRGPPDEDVVVMGYKTLIDGHAMT